MITYTRYNILTPLVTFYQPLPREAQRELSKLDNIMYRLRHIPKYLYLSR